MDRVIIETTKFSKTIETLLRKRQLLNDDYEEFKKLLRNNPEQGDLIIQGLR